MNEFIARKGLTVLSNGATITGSVAVTSTVSASGFIGNATSATTAISSSYAQNASTAITASAATSITFVPATASYATIAQSVVGGTANAETASYVEYANVANKPALVSSSAQISYTGITNVPANIVSSSVQINYGAISNVPANIVSSSAQIVAGIAGQNIVPGTVNGIYIPALATTGSNTFVGNQIFQGNITIIGTSSVAHVTSSQVNVGNNKIVVNVTDWLRYGGLSIYDSGSSGKSGSLYWDSLRDTFVAEQGTATPTSSLFILGPRNTGGLGGETGLTANRIPKSSPAGNGQHIVDSQIVDDGTAVSIPGMVYLNGGVTIANALHTTSSALVNIGTIVVGTVSATAFDSAQWQYVVKNSTSVRSGVIMSAWSASVATYTDYSTTDIGITTDVEFEVDVVGGNARLKAVAASNGWTVKAILSAI